MKLYYEWGIRQLRKEGEELCGDSVGVSRHQNSVTVALSDVSKYPKLKYTGENTLSMKFLKQGMADFAGLIPGVERVDPYTVKWVCNSGLDIYKKVFVLVSVSTWADIVLTK